MQQFDRMLSPLLRLHVSLHVQEQCEGKGMFYEVDGDVGGTWLRH